MAANLQYPSGSIPVVGFNGDCLNKFTWPAGVVVRFNYRLLFYLRHQNKVYALN